MKKIQNKIVYLSKQILQNEHQNKIFLKKLNFKNKKNKNKNMKDYKYYNIINKYLKDYNFQNKKIKYIIWI